ncbi:uncharacterized protein A4U43_C10F9190, partial [Asparagus officinalis]
HVPQVTAEMVEADVIHLDVSGGELFTTELVKAPQGEGAEARAFVGEGESSGHGCESTRRGKDLIKEEEIVPFAGLEYSFPHKVADIREEE